MVTLAVLVTGVVTAVSVIGALVSFDGSYLEWTGFNLVFFGLALWVKWSPNTEH